jgi:ABC-2 type transport system permease protein
VNNLSEFLIRVSAFARKEVDGIIRQPRLVAILILGPFLILLIFGLGYTNQERTLDIIIVIPDGSTIKERITRFSDRLRGVNLVGFVDNEVEADSRLDNREVDLVVVTPTDPLGDIRAGRHATLEFHHHEIDPLEQLYVRALERAYVEAINREVLTIAADRGKSQAGSIDEKVQDALTDAKTLQLDLEQGNGPAALKDLEALTKDIQVLTLAINNGLAAYEGVQSLADETNPDQPQSIFGNIAEVERLMTSLALLDETQGSYAAEAEQAATIVEELKVIDQFLEEIQKLDSRVVASPFDGVVSNLSGVELKPIDFYVPGVIALLLQHISVSLAALAIVREMRGGSIELFRAAPISSFETLLGKSISYLVLTAILAAILTALVILGLTIPMLGSWAGYALVVLALLFTSLSLGFALSVVSGTDTQAVQYSMIVLLASIFFSGFFIALHRLVGPVHLVSWLLPATYGTFLLQDVMLRGLPVNPLILNGLVVYGIILFIFSWWRLRHKMASV